MGIFEKGDGKIFMNEQIDLFSYSMPRFKIDKPIRLIELFAGIGSQAKALENLGVPFEHWFVSEIDKYAIASYNAIHGTNFETSDIQKIHAADLKIAEREVLLYRYLFVPLPGLESCRKPKGHEQRKWHTIRTFVGSGKTPG